MQWLFAPRTPSAAMLCNALKTTEGALEQVATYKGLWKTRKMTPIPLQGKGSCRHGGGKLSPTVSSFQGADSPCCGSGEARAQMPWCLVPAQATLMRHICPNFPLGLAKMG